MVLLSSAPKAAQLMAKPPLGLNMNPSVLTLGSATFYSPTWPSCENISNYYPSRRYCMWAELNLQTKRNETAIGWLPGFRQEVEMFWSPVWPHEENGYLLSLQFMMSFGEGKGDVVAGRTLGVSVEVLHLPAPPRRHQRKCVIMTLGADGTRADLTCRPSSSCSASEPQVCHYKTGMPSPWGVHGSELEMYRCGYSS